MSQFPLRHPSSRDSQLDIERILESEKELNALEKNLNEVKDMSPEYPVKEEIPPLTESEKKILNDAVNYIQSKHPDTIVLCRYVDRGILIEIIPPKSAKIGHRGSGV